MRKNRRKTDARPRKLLMAVMATATAVLVASSSLIFYWEIVDSLDVTIVETNLTSGTGPIRAGDEVKLHRKVCSSRDTEARVSRYIVNDFVLKFGEETVRVEKGCNDYHFGIKMPSALHPGNYGYRAVLTMQVNPLKTTQIQLRDFQFTVVP